MSTKRRRWLTVAAPDDDPIWREPGPRTGTRSALVIAACEKVEEALALLPDEWEVRIEPDPRYHLVQFDPEEWTPMRSIHFEARLELERR